MKISIYKGLEDELFCILGKFAMDANLIKKLGNPITTDKDSTWIVATLGSGILGFCRLKKSSNRNIVSNLCINPNNEEKFEKIIAKIFDEIIAASFENANKELPIISYADKITLPHFERNLFKINKQGVSWHTVIREKI